MAWKNKSKEEIREYHREYARQRHPDKKKTKYEKQKIRRNKAVAEFQDYKKTLKCANCDEKHPACLEFHHANGDKLFDVSSAASSRAWSINKLKTEIAKCVVLCSNCHKKHHYNERLQAVAQRESIPFGAEGSLVQS